MFPSLNGKDRDPKNWLACIELANIKRPRVTVNYWMSSRKKVNFNAQLDVRKIADKKATYKSPLLY